MSKNMYPDGAQLVLKAKDIAERLNVHEFKGSNRWVEKMEAVIRQMSVCGEYGDVCGDTVTVTFWKECLLEILLGY